MLAAKREHLAVEQRSTQFADQWRRQLVVEIETANFAANRRFERDDLHGARRIEHRGIGALFCIDRSSLRTAVATVKAPTQGYR
jgi:hypothetical protein